MYFLIMFLVIFRMGKKLGEVHDVRGSAALVAPQGFEPRYDAPEAAVRDVPERDRVGFQKPILREVSCVGEMSAKISASGEPCDPYA
jgi:hypothetical protein